MAPLCCPSSVRSSTSPCPSFRPPFLSHKSYILTVVAMLAGALHWGMEFAGYGGHKGYKRLALGMAPVLYAWPTLALDPTFALIAQWVGFTGLWWADLHATTVLCLYM